MTPTTAPLPPLVRAALLGAVTGVRSQAGPALLANAAARGDLPEPDALPAALRHPWAAPLATLSAAGEVVGDKLPFVPARTSPPVLASRLVFGGAVGALTMRAQGRDPVPGALVGAAAAGATALAATTLRRTVAKRTNVPDLPVGLAEDALVLLVGLAALPRRG